MPGFIEGHAHYMRLGASTLELNLNDAMSWDEIVDRVAAAVAEAEPGELITGHGWHQERWTPASRSERRRTSVPCESERGVAG
jgi:predicted amidohydrolase YtcJ